MRPSWRLASDLRSQVPKTAIATSRVGKSQRTAHAAAKQNQEAYFDSSWSRRSILVSNINLFFKQRAAKTTRNISLEYHSSITRLIDREHRTSQYEAEKWAIKIRDTPALRAKVYITHEYDRYMLRYKTSTSLRRSTDYISSENTPVTILRHETPPNAVHACNNIMTVFRTCA